MSQFLALLISLVGIHSLDALSLRQVWAESAPQARAVHQGAPFALTPEEKRKLPVEFQKTLTTEERAFDHQEKASMKEFNSAQATALKGWRQQEKKTRRAFFEQHESGPDRRAYVQGYLARKTEFDQVQKNDLATSKSQWKQKREAMKQSQAKREAEFKATLEQGKLPPHSLWVPESIH